MPVYKPMNCPQCGALTLHKLGGRGFEVEWHCVPCEKRKEVSRKARSDRKWGY